MTKCLSTLVQDVEFNTLELALLKYEFFFHKQYFIEAIRQNQQSLLTGRTIYKSI